MARINTLPSRIQMAETRQIARAPRIAATPRTRGRKWMTKRQRWLQANPLCCDCQGEGRVTEGQEVDHVIPLWRGGADDESNYATRCKLEEAQVIRCGYSSSEQPAFNPATHKAEQIAPAEIDSVLTQQWRVVALTQAELAQIEVDRLAAEQAAKDAARVTVTKRQALLALFDLRGIKDSDIDAKIDLIPDETQRYRARVDWAGSAAIESDSPTVLMLAAGLSLSEQDLSMLFDYAQAL